MVVWYRDGRGSGSASPCRGYPSPYARNSSSGPALDFVAWRRSWPSGTHDAPNSPPPSKTRTNSMSQRPPWAASLRSSPHPLQYPARRRRHPPPTCSRRSSATPCPSEGRLAEKLSATASVHPDALNLLLSYVSLLQATFGSKRY